MAEKKKKDDRRRTWTLIVYPESAPDNWKDLINEEHVSWVCSPLHDQDVNPDGTKKKPHWHVVLMFDGKKSYDQIKALADKINSPIPKRVESVRGMIRYLIHLDNPEKYQYSKEDIEVHGGADIEKYFLLAGMQKSEILEEITEFIQMEHITSFTTFMTIARQQPTKDWFEVASQGSTYYITQLIKAEWQAERRNQNIAKDVERVTNDMSKRKQERLDIVKRLLKKKKSQKVIADTLGVSTRTVRNYIQEIKDMGSAKKKVNKK